MSEVSDLKDISNLARCVEGHFHEVEALVLAALLAARGIEDADTCIGMKKLLELIAGHLSHAEHLCDRLGCLGEGRTNV